MIVNRCYKVIQTKGSNNIDSLDDIKDDVVLHNNSITLETSFPYVFDNLTRKNIMIPENMYDEIVNLIKIRTDGNVVYC